MKAFLKKNFFGISGIIISIFIIVFFCFKDNNFSKIISIIVSVNKVWFSIALLSMVIYVLLEALALYILQKHIWKGYKYTYTLKVSCLGLFYNAVTPFSSGGQPMQMYAMGKYGKSYGESGSILTLKSIIHQVCLTVCSIIAVFVTFDVFNNQVGHFMLFVILGLVINIVAVFFMVMFLVNIKKGEKIVFYILKLLHKIHIVKNYEGIVSKIKVQVSHFSESSRLFKSAKLTILKSYLVNSIQFLIYYYISYCIYRSLGLSGTSMLIMISGQAIITMITAFIPLPGGSGAAEGSFYLFFSLFFTPTTIVPAIFLWRFITYYSVIMFGGIVSLKS